MAYDVDSDGDLDVLSTSRNDNTVALYRSLLCPTVPTSRTFSVAPVIAGGSIVVQIWTRNAYGSIVQCLNDTLNVTLGRSWIVVRVSRTNATGVPVLATLANAAPPNVGNFTARVRVSDPSGFSSSSTFLLTAAPGTVDVSLSSLIIPPGPYYVESNYTASVVLRDRFGNVRDTSDVVVLLTPFAILPPAVNWNGTYLTTFAVPFLGNTYLQLQANGMLGKTVAMKVTNYCPPGSLLLPIGSCAPCPLDTYSSLPNQMTCVSCPFGRTTHGLTGSASYLACLCRSDAVLEEDVCVCPPGTYSLGATDPCVLCPIGFVSNATAGSGCIPCSVDSTANAARTRCFCNVGTYGNPGSCKACPSGAVCSGFGMQPSALPGYFPIPSDRGAAPYFMQCSNSALVLAEAFVHLAVSTGRCFVSNAPAGTFPLWAMFACAVPRVPASLDSSLRLLQLERSPFAQQHC
eukprot:c27219_g1_i1.p1 GENE.c27219_g1_i1~~c27219_g1_i1.p1  ORF type:complete len:460 (+),score=30.46 c27219_g1_i1:1-1380(+)